MVEFRNEPYTDFAEEKNKKVMEAAINQVRGELGRRYPLIIGGERIETGTWIVSRNPGNLEQVIGHVAKGDKELAARAIAVATQTFPQWKRVSPQARAGYLFKAAAELRRRKLEFMSWIIFEIGKNWAEADADVAEAIDFLEFYGREMLRLSERQPLTRLEGENNELVYIPLGVGVIIPPWNFPLAILTGMTVSAVVTGNTVVLKPASNAVVIACKFTELMESVGIPPGVINLLPGSGGEIGDYLVSHPKTRFISFTGSKEVGLRINELAARTAAGQIWMKRVVAEMGGKGAVIVDASADINAAVDGIVASAFGYQGQKCSAGSRAIVHEAVYHEVLAGVVEKVKALGVGPAEKNYPLGPVIDENAYNKVLRYIEIGKAEGRLVAGGEPVKGQLNGYYVLPTVFADVSPEARIAQEEIFGPVLAFIKARDFGHALEIFNNTEYGLTGSLYTNRREQMERAKEDMHCGNLYFNRKSTGALVGVHPFGGFNMSGTDSKAGGRDYLLLFTQAKVWSEKL